MANRYITEFKWAFIFMGALLLWAALERVLGFHDKYIDKWEYFTMLFMIPAVWLYVLALIDKKKTDYNGQMSYKQGFMSGLIITMVITVCTPVTQWIIYKIITPDYFSNAIAFSVREGYDSLKDAQESFSYVTYAAQSTVWAFIMGVFTSLVVAIFVRSKNTYDINSY